MPRKQPESQPLFADDSTDEEAEPISKPQRSGLKKRLSVRVVDPEDGRAPAKTVNINDDAAEKRRRRKSHKIHVVDREDQQQAEGSRQARQRQLRTVAQESQANVQVKLDTYEQWMKLATDNKINAANSWNVALIDYFHDMSLLRNDEDNTINFQRASCTLDGCVKIWTSRVDSVHTETGKLLSNLSNETANDGSEDEDQDDDENGGPSQGKEKKKRKRGGATLAKDYESLQSKKLDLEFNVDPLFKKTSADFDEGGASGLLMNHLSLGLGTDGSRRVVLDASDTMVAVDEDDTSVEEPEKRINFGHLRKFIPDLEDIVERTLCPSLEDFSFHRSTALDDEPVPFYADDIFGDDDDDGFGFGDSAEPNGDEAMDIDGDAPPVPPEVDFFTGADAINEDYGNGGGAWGADEGADGSEENGSREGGSAGPHSAAPGGPGTFVDFDPRQAPNRRDLVMAMSDDAGGALGYFDQSMLKNWAGPEHWKTKRTLRKVDDANKPATKRKTKEKEVFKIDFTTPIEKSHKDIQKELFAPPDKINSLSIPKATKAKETDNLLPDDMHFDARQLVTLFLKPKFTIKMRKHGLSLAAGDDREQVDEAYWARGAAEAAKDNQDVDPDDPFAATQGGGAVPFNTQFLHDDDDDNNAFDLGFDDPFPTMDDLASAAVAREERETNMEEQDLIAATQGQTRRAQAPPVRFAKKAKRVDVRRLKENIWKGLEIIVDESGVAKEHDDEDEDMEPPPTDPAQAPLTNPEEAREFSNVISGLTERYPKDKMEEISTSFCFICLLHLANERGLKLDPGESKIEDDEEQNPSRHDEEDSKAVGNLWDLKIYRDPEAFVDL